MHSLIAWCGFFGAWLLVAGPMYQAALELTEQDVQRDQMRMASQNIELPPQISPWWWLLPPVMYLLRRRRSRKIDRMVMAALTPHQLEGLVEYLSKATGWLYVGGGGFLIASKETWELHEHYEWPGFVFWLIVLFMLGLSVSNTAAQMARTRRVLAREERDELAERA